MLIDGLARASPIDDPEACIYGYGAVRFLTNASLATSASVHRDNRDKSISGNGNSNTTATATTNSNNNGNCNNNKARTLAQRLVKHGVVPLMIIHLQVINEAVNNSSQLNSSFYIYISSALNLFVPFLFHAGC